MENSTFGVRCKNRKLKMPGFEMDPDLFPSNKLTWHHLREMIHTRKFDKLQRSIKQERFYRNYTHKLKTNWISMYDFILHHKFSFDAVPVPVPVSALELASVSNLTPAVAGHDSLFVAYHEDDCEGDLSLLPAITPAPPGKRWGVKFKANASPSSTSNSISISINNIDIRTPGIKKRALALNDFPYYLEEGVEHWCLWKLWSDVTKEDIDWGVGELRRQEVYSEILHWVNPVHLKSLPDIDHAHIVCLRK